MNIPTLAIVSPCYNEEAVLPELPTLLHDLIQRQIISEKSFCYFVDDGSSDGTWRLIIYFLGGIQLLGIGVLGEYLGKIFLEVKRSPRFIKELALNELQDENSTSPLIGK